MAGDCKTGRGTVTPIGSLFPPEESLKAARRVEGAIAGHRKEVDRLRGFIADNSALSSLVIKLPDELSHEIMVPFGSVAFFPGRLIHTNEFLVLLGDGYYAERTAIQTDEILRRRGKVLETQVRLLEDTILDLEAEAKFFESTASEAAEGLFEIREELIEEPQEIVPESGLHSLGSSESDNSKVPNKDAEYARIMTKLDELEKEELAANNTPGSDEDEEALSGNVFPNESKTLGDDEHNGFSNEIETSVEEKYNTPAEKSIDLEMFDSNSAESIVDSKMEFSSKDGYYKNNVDQSPTEQKPQLPHELKGNHHGSSVPKLEDSSDFVACQTSKTGFDASKAFTGSIIEHDYGLQPGQLSKSSTSGRPSGSNPSKPFSRFKMLRGSR